MSATGLNVDAVIGVEVEEGKEEGKGPIYRFYVNGTEQWSSDWVCGVREAYTELKTYLENQFEVLYADPGKLEEKKEEIEAAVENKKKTSPRQTQPTRENESGCRQ